MLSKHYGPLRDELRYGPVVAFRDELRAIDCEVCGYAHLDPLPPQQQLDEFWEKFYSAPGSRLLEQDTRQARYWRLVWRERMREFARLTNLGGAGRLLDYGAGLGGFIEYVRQNYLYRGWLTFWGYEPSQAWERADSVCVFSQLPTGMNFHAVNCSLVLEHVRDPLAMLRQIYDLLLPGGVACIIVPNEFNPLQCQMVERYGYSPLHLTHVNYFTPATLEWLVRRAGFEVERRTATFPIEWLALHGFNYVSHSWRRYLGAAAHKLRMAFEMVLLTIAPHFKQRLYERFAARGIGREIELWVRKPS